jgi:eukaryotic-like serine/threonine-protein kinase
MLEPVGSGGAGQVWRARDEVLDREVALKRVQLPRALSEEEREEVRQRAVREAQAAARLSHRSVTTVHDVVDDGADTAIVMEYVPARDLTRIVEEDGPLDESRAAAIGLEVLDALEVAHRAGIVHRDVKPSNVMVPEHGPVKLTDFGIATLNDHPSITTSGVVLGSPAYMSPEQASGRGAVPATDLWGLGATLYFAIEGRSPFERDGTMATLHALVNDQPGQMERGRQVRPALDRLFSKDPADRPATDEVRQMLTEIRDGAVAVDETRPVAAVAPGSDASTTETQTAAPAATEPATSAEPEPGPETRPEPEREQEPEPAPRQPGTQRQVEGREEDDRDRRRMMTVIGSLVALLVLGLIGLALVLPGGPDGDGVPTADEDTAEQEEAAEDDAQDAGNADEPGGFAADAEPPDDWTTYEPDGEPYSIAHPPDWEVREHGDNRTDLVDPDTGTYLRIDWTDEPHPDPVADRQEFAETLAARQDAYEEVRLEPATYRGHDAAVWEYSYVADGAELRAMQLNISGDAHGYALNLQSSEARWDEDRELFEPLAAGFQPEG